MADISKSYVDFAGLQQYDTLIKSKISNDISNAVNALDVSEFVLASASNGVVTIKGIQENDGKIAAGTTTANDVVLAKVATTGAAEDISVADAGEKFTGTTAEAVLTEIQGNIETLDSSLADVAKSGEADDVEYDPTNSGLTATNVQAAIDEVAEATAGGVDSKSIYVTDNETPGTGYLKVYKIYQGSEGSAASPVAGELKGTINIPKDLVVTAGSVGTVTVADEPYPGAKVGDKYIDLTIANQTEHIYIPANSLVDIYTVQQSATQIQLAINANNEISATIVAGSVGTTELTNSAVTTAKIADDAVTADKVSISAHTESHTAGADGIAVSVTTTDGQVSGVTASIAANTYDAYGAADAAAAAAVEALDTTSDVGLVSHNATSGAVTFTGSMAESNGVIETGTADTVTFTPATTAQIANLFT